MSKHISLELLKKKTKFIIKVNFSFWSSLIVINIICLSYVDSYRMISVEIGGKSTADLRKLIHDSGLKVGGEVHK